MKITRGGNAPFFFPSLSSIHRISQMRCIDRVTILFKTCTYGRHCVNCWTGGKVWKGFELRRSSLVIHWVWKCNGTGPNGIQISIHDVFRNSGTHQVSAVCSRWAGGGGEEWGLCVSALNTEENVNLQDQLLRTFVRLWKWECELLPALLPLSSWWVRQGISYDSLFL